MAENPTRVLEIVEKCRDDTFICVNTSSHTLASIKSPEKLEVGVKYRFYKTSNLHPEVPEVPVYNYKFSPKKMGISKTEVKEEDLTAFRRKLFTAIDESCGNPSTSSASMVKSLAESTSDIIVKVTEVSKLKKGKFGDFYIVTCRDVDGKKAVAFLNQTKMTENFPQVKEVFNFKNCSFDTNKEKININRNTTLVQIQDDHIRRKFDEVNDFDFKITTTLVGYDKLNVYKSCQNCDKKITNTEVCNFCNNPFEQNPPKDDFSVILYIDLDQDEDSEDPLISITAFGKYFPFEDITSQSNITNQLDTLIDKESIFEFDDKANNLTKEKEYMLKRITF